MEIILTVVLTLLFVAFGFSLYILYSVQRELQATQAMLQQLADFINQMGLAIQDAKEIIEFKKNKLGLGRDVNEEDYQ